MCTAHFALRAPSAHAHRCAAAFGPAWIPHSPVQHRSPRARQSPRHTPETRPPCSRQDVRRPEIRSRRHKPQRLRHRSRISHRPSHRNRVTIVSSRRGRAHAAERVFPLQFQNMLPAPPTENKIDQERSTHSKSVIVRGQTRLNPVFDDRF